MKRKAVFLAVAWQKSAVQANANQRRQGKGGPRAELYDGDQVRRRREDDGTACGQKAPPEILPRRFGSQRDHKIELVRPNPIWAVVGKAEEMSNGGNDGRTKCPGAVAGATPP